LRICLGAQQIAKVLGARVFVNPEREIGWWPVSPVSGATGPVAGLLGTTIDAFHWHGETFDLPAGANRLCQSTGCRLQAFSWQENVLALQFHLKTTPDSASDIISHSDEQDRPGRFVQSAKSMLDDPRKFSVANRLMVLLLDRLSGKRTGN